MHDGKLPDLSAYVMAMTSALCIPVQKRNAVVKMAASSAFSSVTERRCSTAVGLQDVAHGVLSLSHLEKPV